MLPRFDILAGSLDAVASHDPDDFRARQEAAAERIADLEFEPLLIEPLDLTHERIWSWSPLECRSCTKLGEANAEPDSAGRIFCTLEHTMIRASDCPERETV
jgi:hypothetical protein